jgi:hypothetical protein
MCCVQSGFEYEVGGRWVPADDWRVKALASLGGRQGITWSFSSSNEFSKMPKDPYGKGKESGGTRKGGRG